jgi:hypothetical protein
MVKCKVKKLYDPATSPPLKKGIKMAVRRTKGIITSDLTKTKGKGMRESNTKMRSIKKYPENLTNSWGGVETITRIRTKKNISLTRGSRRWIMLPRSLYLSRKECFILLP